MSHDTVQASDDQLHATTKLAAAPDGLRKQRDNRRQKKRPKLSDKPASSSSPPLQCAGRRHASTGSLQVRCSLSSTQLQVSAQLLAARADARKMVLGTGVYDGGAFHVALACCCVMRFFADDLRKQQTCTSTHARRDGVELHRCRLRAT